MAKLRDLLAIIDTRLAADVLNNGTFTVGYPAGTTQQSFTSDLYGPNSYAIVAENDKWTVAAAQLSFAYGASLITVTNTSGVTWKAGSRFIANVDQVDGNDVSNILIPVTLANVGGNVDVVTSMKLGVIGKIEYVEWVQGKPVTTAAKLATLTPAIGGVPCTGGAIALTSALCTPLGAVIAGSDVTALNVLTRDSLFSLKATGVTAFVEGDGFVSVRVRRTPSDSY